MDSCARAVPLPPLGSMRGRGLAAADAPHRVRPVQIERVLAFRTVALLIKIGDEKKA